MPFDVGPPPGLWLPPKPAIIQAWKRDELKLGFLPGFFPPGAAAVGLTTLTQVLSATDSAGATMTLPVGIQAGDLIVLWDHAVSAATPVTAVPSGFNSIANDTVGDGFNRVILSYKVAVGTESGATITGMTNNGTAVDLVKLVYVFRGNQPIKAVNVVSAAIDSIHTNPTAQVVSSGSGKAPLVVIGAYSCYDGTINPRSFTPAKDGEINVTGSTQARVQSYLAYKIYNSAPADVTIDMDDEGNGNSLASCYISCS
jgi:hypothetical protein